MIDSAAACLLATTKAVRLATMTAFVRLSSGSYEAITRFLQGFCVAIESSELVVLELVVV